MARGNIAHVEDFDEENGVVIQGTGQYAQSIAPGSSGKTKANSKSRREKTTRRPATSPQHALTDSDDTVHPVVSDKRERERERRAGEREAAAAAAAAAADKDARREEKRQLRKEQERAARHAERERAEREREQRERATAKKSAVRPSAKHVKTAPVVHAQQSDQYRRPRFDDDASQYGIQTTSGSRPRAMSSRPSSYYGPGSRPPTSNKQWHSTQAASPFTPAPNPSPFAPSPHAPPLASQHAPSPFSPGPIPVPMHEQSPFAPGTSYPPPAWGPGSAPYPMQPPPPQTPTDYFPPDLMSSSPRHSNLARRFQQRPSSAMGHRSMSVSSFDLEDYGPTYEQENIVRRQSLKIRDVEDRKLMPPPPPRSRTAVPSRQALRPPPPQRQIASHGYESDDFDGDESMYQEIVPRGYEYDDGVVSRPRSHRRGSSTYSREGYQIEPVPASRSSRRHSYMAGESSSMSQSKYDSAAAAALAYQNGVSGAAEPLTAAALSKAEKKSKSSRSSGSSGSRDESEFRRSATTRTTRSSTGDGEDITIKVTGQAVLRVGNAEIQCQDGGEINISQPGRLGGSDRASTIYSDDRRSRMERLPIRARSPSQSDSYSRAQYDGYEHPRIPFT
ncbi:hypothetical protein CGRA01v4_14567 [Colletotrichum graminicola]|uniref:Uncharacterized protein n=1 Tax=Colletotrichum graminicola (strain M1.001 / M2 / FGSC 10212) TaxID=645133 RepID=E3Q4U2_COLGM|nr:uncharacterized protein GLRG_01251 [Colletotrichum graminicola M1.001]EFQ26107.1 hypothetical protein GLRG_01251 [Colletotrichum graminicola M1.001]WDK23275.1 hypothetical protein CGRA01v4_14567 [Colletotrichum graminicola]